jgi:hypothetical protein
MERAQPLWLHYMLNVESEYLIDADQPLRRHLHALPSMSLLPIRRE